MKIASFNVQRFGRAKVSDPHVLSTLVKVKYKIYKYEVDDFSSDLLGNSTQLNINNYYNGLVLGSSQGSIVD